MRKLIYESAQQMREQLKGLEGVSGVYVVTFPDNFDYEYDYINDSGNSVRFYGTTENPNYVGETKDLYKRLVAHIGNMDLTNKGSQSRGHQIERCGFKEFGTYTIEIYLAPEEELNYYENFMVWLEGSFSQSKYSRKSRSAIPEVIADDFKQYESLLETFYKNEMPDIPAAPKPKSKPSRAYDYDPILDYIIAKSKKKEEKKEKDYGF